MAKRATPFLIFDGSAEEAMALYVDAFKAARIDSIVRYGPEGPGRAGAVKQATMTLAGLELMCIDSPVRHEFTFTPAISLFIDCESAAELDALFARLSHGGNVMMPLDNYGFSEKFAWISDRFGVSWQLNLPERDDDS